jgi:hypothetical protein
MAKSILFVFVLALSLATNAAGAVNPDPSLARFKVCKGFSLESRREVEVVCKMDSQTMPGSNTRTSTGPGRDSQPDSQDRVQMYSY